MRSKKELYEIILDKFKTSICRFICNSIYVCLESGMITYEEYNFIMDDFNSNYPSEEQHNEFFIHKKFMKNNKHGSWWGIIEDNKNDDNIRIQFLNKLISISE